MAGRCRIKSNTFSKSTPSRNPSPFKVSRYSGKDEVMPEEIALSLNRAARDVIAERQRQISAEGYSLYRDDLYVNGELAEAGATYASLAGKPTTRSTA